MAAILILRYVKDPDEKLDFGFDWKTAMDGDTIASSAWVVPGGITQDTPSPSNDAYTTTIWLSGGTNGTDYDVVNRVTTAGGRVMEASLLVQVRAA